MFAIPKFITGAHFLIQEIVPRTTPLNWVIGRGIRKMKNLVNAVLLLKRRRK